MTTATNETTTTTPAPAQPAGVPVSTPGHSGRSPLARHLESVRANLEKGEGIGPLGAKGTDQAMGAAKPSEAVAPAVADVPPGDTTADATAATPQAAPESELTQGADGRWRNPDGTFAPPPPAEAVTDVGEDAGATAPDTPTEPAPIVVKLRGRAETDPEVEIEVSDPTIAERLRQNANDGMRKGEYERQKAALEQEKATIREFTTRLETAPESMTEFMDEPTRVRLTRYLLAQHFEHPEVQQFVQAFTADPREQRVARSELNAEALRYQQESNERVKLARKAGEIHGAVRALIPEGTEDDISQQFFRDCITDLTQVAHQRGDIDPREVPSLVTRRLAMYGFNAPTPSPATNGIPTAAPKGPVAEAVAAKKITVAKARVAATQAAQATRPIAAKVAPSGNGAIPVTVQDGPPKGGGIKGALAWARQNWVKG